MVTGVSSRGVATNIAGHLWSMGVQCEGQFRSWRGTVRCGKAGSGEHAGRRAGNRTSRADNSRKQGKREKQQGAVRRMVGAHMLGRLLLFRWVARGQRRGKTRGAKLLVHKGALGGGGGDQRLSPLRSLVRHLLPTQTTRVHQMRYVAPCMASRGGGCTD